MAHPDRQHGITPGVVSSIEAAMAARRAPNGASAADARAAEQLLSAMHTVKAARFNAAERLERKNTGVVVRPVDGVALFRRPVDVAGDLCLDAGRGVQPAHHAGLDHVVGVHAGVGADRGDERLPHEGAPHAHLRAGRERPLSRAATDAPGRRRPRAGVPPPLQRGGAQPARSTTRASTT
jgi:hypothetical protein